MCDYDSKGDVHVPPPDVEEQDDTRLIGAQSPGVARIEVLSKHITMRNRIAIFMGVFLIAYAYGLDGMLRYAYQPTATNKFANHSLLSTINVVRAVVAAAAQVC